MIKLSDYIMKYIVNQNVKDIFMLSGGGCMHLVDSVGRAKGLNYICCLHEQAASYAAGAYAQFTNNLGVALVTTGPGGTNAMTGVAAAWTDSIPLLVISGQVKRNDLATGTGLRFKGYQELDVVSMAKPITKYSVTVTKPEDIKFHLDKAVYLARNGRPGPVWLDIPLDVQAAKIEEEKLKSFTPELENNVLVNQKTISSAIEMIEQSERPVIIAGYGITLSKCKTQFLSLIEKLNIPVLTTWKALDLLPETHPLYFGRPGCIGQRGANFIQQNADLIIALGARLDYGQIGYNHKTFAREAKKIIVDVDEAELNKFEFDVDLPIVANVSEIVKELNSKIINTEKLKFNKWLEYSKKITEKYPVVLPEHLKENSFVSTYNLVESISNYSDENAIFTPENSGAASEVMMQAIKIKSGQRSITMNSLGAMGSGLPASLGASVASGKKQTICVIGDGSLQMNIQDLETIKRLNLPIKFFVLNNDGYGSIKNMQGNHFGGFLVASDPSSGVTNPNTEKIAAAYSIQYKAIKQNSDVETIVKEVLNSSEPILCEVFLDPNEKTMPKLSSQVKSDGSIVSKPLEDLWPFLDRKEFLENMIVKPLEE